VIYQFRLWPDGRSCFPFASDAIREIYEVTPEEVRDDAAVVFTRIHPDDLAEGLRSVERSAADLSMWEWDYRVILPTRGLRYLHGRARPERLADGSTLWHGFISDVTERRAEHDELLRLQAAIDTSITGIALADLAGRVTYANQAALELWGYTDPALVLGRSVAEFWEPGEQARALYQTMLRTGEDAGVMAARRPDGESRRVQVRANVITEHDGQPIGIIASLLDITEAEANANALRVRELAMLTSLNGMAIADPDGRITWANPAFARMWGYETVGEVLGADALAFIDGNGGPRILGEMLASGTWQGEATGRRRDGSTFDLLVAASVVRDDDDDRVRQLMASAVDITEAKRMQSQLAQAQRMETVGRLAGGVAHDFNNLLTVMKGFLALARAQIDTGAPLAKDLGEVDRAVDSAAALTQQLLAFSRRQVTEPQVLDLNDSVRQVRAILERLLGSAVALRLELGEVPARVRIDPNQLEQLLINLAVNARDAMPDGGELTIATSQVMIGADEAARDPVLSPGAHVQMLVRDTGCGIALDVRPQLFEPFFTTKPAGQGTGLGLAMVYGAVTQHEGRVEVVSGPHEGACFRILLPVQHAPVARRTTPSDAVLPRGSETVVVVEDEPAIRLLTVRVLEKQGYTVRAFASGPEALTGMRAMPRRADLLLTDVIMPEMNGRALAEAVSLEWPRMPVLFVSGYTEDVIGNHGILAADVDFLPKPYSVSALAQRVREALDRRLTT
jgi:two-component system cell cycle sensor histidine kinase/response regulator CckA